MQTAQVKIIILKVKKNETLPREITLAWKINICLASHWGLL